MVLAFRLYGYSPREPLIQEDLQQTESGHGETIQQGVVPASPTSLGSQLQQVPWWLRESRKDLNPVSPKPASPRPALRQDGSIRLPQTPPPRSIYSLPHAEAILPTVRRLLGIGASPIRLKDNLSRKDRVLWYWANVTDLDSFLQEVNGSDRLSAAYRSSLQVYTFYARKGFWPIALTNLLDLLCACLTRYQTTSDDSKGQLASS